MPKIAGTMPEDGRIIILQASDRTKEVDVAVSAGAFEFSGLLNSNKILIAVRNSDGRAVSYGNIDPAGEVVTAPTLTIQSSGDDTLIYNTYSDEDATQLNWEGWSYIHALNFRFTSVPVPQGAIIISAYVKLYIARIDTIYDHEAYAQFINEDNSPQRTTGWNSTLYGALPKTSQVYWAIGRPGVLSAPVQTPELKDTLQTVIDRTGWSSGNALTFCMTHVAYKNNGIGFYSVDNAINLPAELHIQYEA